jgi:hypothetical protein
MMPCRNNETERAKTMNIPATIFADAMTAANAAADAENTRLGPEQSRGLDCGFAWVDVPTGRAFMDPHTKAFLAWCKANGHGSRKGYGAAGWQFWSPAKAQTQSISVHYAGAAAFAASLRNAGIRHAAAGQRLD